MEAYAYFKKKREKTNITIRDYAKRAGVSPSFLNSLQNGEYDFRSIPLGKTINLFSLANISIFEFYNMFFPELEKEVLTRMIKWNENHPKELNLEKLRMRFYNRIQQIKGRNRISESDVSFLLNEYNNLFISLRDKVDKKGNITENDYNVYIAPFSYSISKKLEDAVSEEEKVKNELVNLINDEIIKSDLSYAALGNIIGISSRRLSMLKKSPEGFKNMKIGSFLKMCYALNLKNNSLLKINISKIGNVSK